MDEKKTVEEEKYLAAQERVREIKSFYYTLVVYILINILLIVINIVTGSAWWFYWITLIWGVVLISQAFKIFVFKGKFLGKQWEERKIREILDKEKDSRTPTKKE